MKEEEELIKQLRDENEQLRREIELLKEYIKKLESRLAKYENAHTPPSLRRGRNRKKEQKSGDLGKPGRKIGHEGVTRLQAKPDRQVEVTADRCPDCGTELGEPIRIESKIIEELPEPQPIVVTEYRIAHYTCPYCHREVAAVDSGCPSEGRFGNNTIAQTTLLKYEDRLPHRKIQNAMGRIFGLNMSPATILDLTRRAADAVQSQYDSILNRIRNAPILYVDETSIHVQGKLHWIWTFATLSETFFVIRKSRGMKVLLEVLTRRFKGIIVCDGWKSYPKFTKSLQRCWAHLLRESKELAEKIEEAVPLHNALKELYEELNSKLESDPPTEVRWDLWNAAQAILQYWIRKEYASDKVKKLIGKISNGFEYWFTFIVHPGVEPTNNRAERALREHVVLRKIMGTLRNGKGTSIHESIMTVLATWEQEGLNKFQMLRSCLSS
jgi:transposase